jgi:MFS family permease
VEKAIENAIKLGVIVIEKSAKGPAVIYRTYGKRWLVLGIYMFVAALTQLFWLNFSAIDTYIEDTMHISAMSTGFLTLVFPIVYIILSIPAGVLVDKKGFKYGVGIGVVLTGIFAMARLISPHSYTMLLVSQIGIAAGQPFVLNGVTKLVVNWFPPREEATAVGLGSLSMFAGMMISLGATPLLVQSLGFETMEIKTGRYVCPCRTGWNT